MIIKKQKLLFSFGGVIRLYKSFDPDLYFVVSPFMVPVQFDHFLDAYNFAYSLFDERCGV